MAEITKEHKNLTRRIIMTWSNHEDPFDAIAQLIADTSAKVEPSYANCRQVQKRGIHSSVTCPCLLAIEDKDLNAHVRRVLLYCSAFGDSVCLCEDRNYEDSDEPHDDECLDAQRLFELVASPDALLPEKSPFTPEFTGTSSTMTLEKEKEKDFERLLNQQEA